MDTSIKIAALRQLEHITDPTTLHMLSEYGPCMTYEDVARVLKFSAGTIRNSLSNIQSDSHWSYVVRRAKLSFSTKSPRFRTTEIAKLIAPMEEINEP